MRGEDLPGEFIAEIKAYSEQAHYERNAFLLSRALGIRIRPGLYTSVIPGPPPTIILQPHLLGSSGNDHVLHEVGHVVLWWSGIEQALLKEYGDRAPRYAERLCHAAIAFLRAPQNLVDEALRRFGVSAQAAVWLQGETGLSAAAALQRLVYDDSEAIRAGYVLTGNYISEVATCNFRLPFWLHDRVPEPLMHLPDEVNPSLCLAGKGSFIGVCSVAS